MSKPAIAVGFVVLAFVALVLEESARAGHADRRESAHAVAVLTGSAVLYALIVEGIIRLIT